MEPLSAIAAVTAASNAIGFIKSRISDIQSISEISDAITTLFTARDRINKERNAQDGVGEISLRSSINAVVEARKLAESMSEIQQLVDARFPKKHPDEPSAWQEIQAHYNAAKKAEKDRQKKAQVEAARRQQEVAETIKSCAIIFGVLLVAVFFFVVMFMTIARGINGDGYDYSRTVLEMESSAKVYDAG